MLAFICIIAVVLVVVGALTWADAASTSARREQIEQRIREAEAEIDEIGRRTQAAILAEPMRRGQDQRRNR